MIPDERQRRRACQETNRSFAVEASAGTGKTTTLVDRILRLVLEQGPKGQPVPLSGICAISFTEKAAGEMKLRLRQEFEKRADDPDPAGERARAALRDLASAAISTFHSFAVSLLKERPIEAGLDPHFTVLDDARSRLLFREVWEPWINRTLLERRGPIEAALRAGYGLETLHDLAQTLMQHSLAVRSLKLESPPTDKAVGEQMTALLRDACAHQALATNSTDKLLERLDRTIAWLERPEPGAEAPQGPGNSGAKGNWTGGKETVDKVRDFIREVADFCALCGKLPQLRLFDEILRWLIGDFLTEWERRKREGGFLDFDDQLDAARRLLASSRAARSEFQRRFDTLLVDEFQDTDPVQLAIVLLLSSTDLEETDPSRLRPESGRLFIVGDPKQSIYRFRGADIETYLETVDPGKAQASALERLELTTNFRSVPSILRFVDEAFRAAMKSEGNYQPGYLPFGGAGYRKEEPEPPSVHALGDRDEDGGFVGSGREFPKLEASRIARLITRIHEGSGWSIENRSVVKDGTGPDRRPARYGDIAILLPVLTRVDLIEEELRSSGIPYVLEGGKFYYARSEVASAVTVMRSIANPNDAVALYGALRSIFFGLSDEDQLRAHLAGLPLDYRADVPESSAHARPYKILRELHLHRHDRPASETLERLLRQTGAREVLAVRGFQSLANLAKLARTLRMIQQDRTFSQVVDILISMDEEGIAESESRLMEEKSDAVRILSIHKAKGLDFPIIIAAGLGFQIRSQSGNFLADFHGEGFFALKLGSKEDGLRTPGWNRLEESEKRKDAAELTRLLYVALTRARDHLILCVHTRGKMDRASGKMLPDFERTRWKPLAGFLNGSFVAENGLVRFIDPGGLPESVSTRPSGTAAVQDCLSVFRAERAELSGLLSNTPSSRTSKAPAHESDDFALDARFENTARSRAARLGTAFHEAMERAGLMDPAEIPAAAAESGRRHQLDDDAIRRISEMMAGCFGSQLIERARDSIRSGRRLLKEVPYVRPYERDIFSGPAGPGRRTSPSGEDSHAPSVESPVRGVPRGVSEEGVIDLLFEEPDGWILVDYKTDQLPEDLPQPEAYFREKYSSQIERYAEALRAIKIRVKAAYLLLARTGAQIEIPLS